MLTLRKWGKTSGLREFLLFRTLWASLETRHRVHLLSAVGLTFAPVGFVIDFINLPQVRPYGTVASQAALIGLLAAAFAGLLLSARRRAFVGLFIVAAAAFVATRLFVPVREWPLPLEQASLHRRLVLDAVGLLLSSMWGYALFLTFIGNEGVKRVRTLTQISLARELHETLVPPLDRRLGGLDIFGRSAASDEVGGDLVDVWEEGGTVAACVADVSGHGLSAGMVMGMAKSALRTHLAVGRSLDNLMENVNNVLVGLTPSNTFVTLAMVRFRGGKAEFCSAGHLPTLCFSRAEGTVKRLHSREIPLGVFACTAYECAAVPYGKGDLFLLLTDGIVEVRNDAGEMFGLDRVEQLLRRSAEAPLPEIYETIVRSVRAFGRACDDQTILLVRASS